MGNFLCVVGTLRDWGFVVATLGDCDLVIACSHSFALLRAMARASRGESVEGGMVVSVLVK